MRGKHIHINLLIMLLAAFWALPDSARALGEPVAVLLSDSEAAYSQPLAAFTDEACCPVTVYNLQGDIRKDPNLKNKILAQNPPLIFALGAKAAYAAKLWTKQRQDIPVIFAMVYNWQRYKLLDQKNMAGIASEMAPGTQFANMTMFSPEVKRIGVIYSDHSNHFLAEAEKAAALLGHELISERIERSKEFRRSFKKISSRVDAFWVLSDPVIYTLDNMDWLEESCVKERLFCMGQSANIVKLGLTLAINPDFTNIGSQAASLAQSILGGHQSTMDIGVKAPISTQIFVNSKTAERIGLRISQPALDMATKVID